MEQLIHDSVIAILGAVAAVGAVVVVFAFLWGAVGRIAPHDYHDVPMLRRLAVISGLILAAGIVFGGPTAQAVAKYRLFEAGGPWDLSLSDFLAERILVPRRIVAEISRHLAEGSWATIYPTASGLALAVGSALLAYRSWRERRLAVRAALGTLILAFSVAVIAFYAAEASLWLIHKANFWALGILTYLYQRRRNASH